MRVYTDGSCSRRQGGWSAIITVSENEEISIFGKTEDTTNNRMELTAVLEALLYLDRRGISTDVEIITDSQYVIGCATGWKRNINNDLWDLYDIWSKRQKSVKFTWVKGHAGHKYNERADELARGVR